MVFGIFKCASDTNIFFETRISFPRKLFLPHVSSAHRSVGDRPWAAASHRLAWA